MQRLSKTELSPYNGCVIDMKWKLGPLSYHASAAGKEAAPLVTEVIRLPEPVLYDHAGVGGASARTHLSFHYLGDYRHHHIRWLIGVKAPGQVYRGDYYNG